MHKRFDIIDWLAGLTLEELRTLMQPTTVKHEIPTKPFQMQNGDEMKATLTISAGQN